MTLKWGDRVQETFTTTGVGAISLGGPVTGYQSFLSILSNGDTCYYGATDGINWETGIGTYTSAGNILSRTNIEGSSNANAAVNWAAGTKSIWLNAPAAFFAQAQTGALPPTALQVGAILLAKYISATVLAAGQTTAAANLVAVACTMSGGYAPTGDTLAGIWQALSAVPTQNDVYLFQRVG